MMIRQDAADNHGPAPDPAELDARAADAVGELCRGAAPGTVDLDVPLSRLTTFRIGGPASAVARVQTADDARRFLDFSGERGIGAVCLGGGSNVLADDNGFCGLILRMEIGTLDFGPGTVRAGAGLVFDDLVVRSLEEGRPAFAYASGIPGSLGGAVVGNAGCYGHEIGESVLEATVLRADGRIETVGPADLGFVYRSSALKGKRDILLDVLLRAEPGDTTDAERLRAEHLADRRRKHPVDEPCAGSYFQNLPAEPPGGRRRAAGALLDALGARGWRVGDAAVFAKHANIIVNLGRARCSDVLALAARMKEAVATAHGERLSEEVRHLSRYRAWDGFTVDTDAPRPDL